MRCILLDALRGLGLIRLLPRGFAGEPSYSSSSAFVTHRQTAGQLESDRNESEHRVHKKIFDKVCRLVEAKHVDPGMNGVDWKALAQNRRNQIVACTELRRRRLLNGSHV